jgi:hypothetical protein
LIRQAISCDICGAEMQHANHWFVAYEGATELRVALWNPRAKLRGGAKHLCGQTCLHKLMDEFVVRHQPAKAQQPEGQEEQKTSAPRPVRKALRPPVPAKAAIPPPAPQPLVAVHVPAYIDEFESSARLITAATEIDSRAAEFSADPANLSPRNWHAEAWKREREREQRASDHHARRRSIA